MNNIEARFAAIEKWLELFVLIELVFVGLALLELTWDIYQLRQQKAACHSRLTESLANIGIAVGNTLLERTVYGLTFIIGLLLVEYFQPFRFPDSPWVWILAIVIADFTYYWMHRFEHEIRFLWAYHSVHHSSPQYDLTTAARLAWIEGLFEWIFFIPMILLGFDVVQTLLGIVVVVVYQTWLHTQKIGSLGILDKCINTPAVHRVHHASNEVYLDKNYGGILMIWDHWFGTYALEREGEPVIYGVTKPIETWNPLMVNVHEYRAIWRDCRAAKSWSDVWKHMVAGPGWRPESRE